jgi:tripartite-type tricarboxylate transporter receptor subunit TctC
MPLPCALIKHRRATAFVSIALAAILGMSQRPAAAEDWPRRPLVVAFAPGALLDFVGRLLANDLSAALGQPVVVENKTGGGGVVATAAVAKTAPDGYTLLLTAIGPAVLRPLMDKTISYDTDADFTPVIMLGDSPNILAANPHLGLNTVKDLEAYIKERQGEISIAHSGPGTMGHLLSVLFAAEAGADASLVTYRGSAPMLIDLAGGQIDIGFLAYGAGAAATKILAVTTDERVDFLPLVPTLKESGFDIVGSTWIAIFAPAHTPPDIVVRLNAVIDAFLRKPEIRQRFAETGFRALGGSSARLREIVRRDRTRWSKIVDSAMFAGDKFGGDK